MQEKSQQATATLRQLDTSDDYRQSSDSFPAQYDYSNYLYRSPLWIPPKQRGPVLLQPPPGHQQLTYQQLPPPPPIDAAPLQHDTMPLPLFNDKIMLKNHIIIPQPIKIYWADHKLLEAIKNAHKQVDSVNSPH